MQYTQSVALQGRDDIMEIDPKLGIGGVLIRYSDGELRYAPLEEIQKWPFYCPGKDWPPQKQVGPATWEDYVNTLRIVAQRGCSA